MYSVDNSYASSISNYTGSRFSNLEQDYLSSFGGRVSRHSDEQSSASRLSPNSDSGLMPGNSAQSHYPTRRTNGMQDGFGPAYLPEGLRMNVAGTDQSESPEEPTVEIKQTIRTEYKIKKDGVVYVGAVNETNIWGSHQYPQY